MVKYIEFQAVVLAGGKGSRMIELTAGKPKCLLPIHNKPMIFYPLHTLQKAGFTEAIVIVTENIKREVCTALDKLGLSMKLELMGIPDSEDLGTADALRYIHDKITKDFVVVSCDLIADINISEILNSYRKYNAAIVALMLPAPIIPSNIVTPGVKSKQKPETDLIGIDNKTNRLVFLASASDFEDYINISQKLLRKHTSFTMHSKLLDAHFYVINKWVLEFLVHNESFGTLKGELLPYIVNKQLSCPTKSIIDDKNPSVVTVDTRDDIFRFAIERDLDEIIRNMSAFNDHSFDLEKVYYGDLIKCYAHISNTFGLRANTIQMYSFANSMMTELPLFDMAKESISPLATVKSTQITNCCIDDGAIVDEKTSIKQSHVGCGSVIESKTRITNTVIMQNVTIKERCIIQDCILCNGCTIEAGTELRNCLVGAQHNVPLGSNLSHEVLMDNDRLMEI